jgi:hypothetical protein
VKNYLAQVTGTVGNGKKLITATGNSRPSTDGRDWRLCGDEYGGQCAINSDGVIVMSTVLAF